MSLNSLPSLILEYYTVFNASKRFYHFNHSHYLKSINILELSIKQYNSCVDQMRLLEESLREIERGESFIMQLTDLNLKSRILKLHQNQASLLNNAKSFLSIQDQQTKYLLPIVKSRRHCQQFEHWLKELEKRNKIARTSLAEEIYNQMELSSKEAMHLNQDQFNSFHQYLEKNASAKLRGRYHRLNWFLQLENDVKLAQVEIEAKVLYLLPALKSLFEKKVGSLSKLFFNHKDKKELIKKHFYLVSKIKSSRQLILTLFNTTSVKSFSEYELHDHPCLIAIKRLEDEIIGIKQQRQQEYVTGLNQYFYRTTNTAIKEEVTFLTQHFSLLQETKIRFLEKALEALEKKYSFSNLILPPVVKIREMEVLLAQCEQTISRTPPRTPLDLSLLNNFQSLKNKYESACDIAKHLIENIMNNDSYFKQQQRISGNGITYLACEQESLHHLLTSLKDYVDISQQEAIEALEVLLLGEEEFDLIRLKEKLIPLFRSYEKSEEVLGVFLNKIVKRYIAPALHDPKSKHFKFLDEYNHTSMNSWVSKKINLLEDALLFLQTVYLEKVPLNHKSISISSKPFTFDMNTFITQIKLLLSFSDVETGKDLCSELYHCIEQVIVKNADVLCSRADWLEGVLMLTDHSLKVNYIQALLVSCLQSKSFDILLHPGLMQFINQNTDALLAVKQEVSQYLRHNEWHSTLQQSLEKLNDPELAKEARFVYIQKILNDESFSNYHYKELNSSKCLDEYLGEHNIESLYLLLVNYLSAEKSINAEALSLIDSLLQMNWPLDIRPLKTLFDEKRKLLIENTEVSAEAREIMSLIKHAKWTLALSRIKEHILLAPTDISRSSFHCGAVIEAFKQLSAFHQSLKRDIKSGLRQETADDRSQRWTFYRELRSFIKNMAIDENSASSIKPSLDLAFCQLESEFLIETNPIAYFFGKIREVQEKKLKDKTHVIEFLTSVVIEMKNNIGHNELAAIECIIGLMTAKWIPVNESELKEKIGFLIEDLEPHFSYNDLIRFFLTTYILPNINSIKSHGFNLLYEKNPRWVGKIIEEEKDKIEGSLYLLKKVFTETSLLNSSHPIMVKNTSILPTTEICKSAIEDLIYFIKWHQDHVIEKNISANSNDRFGFQKALYALVKDYIEKFKTSRQKNLDFLPLIQACENDSLLDEYICIWVRHSIHNSRDYSCLHSDPIIIQYGFRDSVQTNIKKLCIHKYQLLAQKSSPTSEKGLSSQLAKMQCYPEQSEQLFPLIDLLNQENKQDVLSKLISKQTLWQPRWQHYLGTQENLHLAQSYRFLFLQNLLSNPVFCQKYSSSMQPVKVDTFEELYGKENLSNILKLMMNYADGRPDIHKQQGYQYIAMALDCETITEPWLAIKEKVHQHLLNLQSAEVDKTKIIQLIEKVSTKQYIDVRCHLEQLILNTKVYDETRPEFMRNCELLYQFNEALKLHLLDLIKRKEVCEVAIIRDYVLQVLPNSKIKQELEELCRQHTCYHFDRNNIQIAKLYRCLYQFEEYAWQTLKQTVPTLKGVDSEVLKSLVSSSGKHHQKDILYITRQIEKKGRSLGFSDEFIMFYRRQSPVINKIICEILKAHYDFQELGLGNEVTDKNKSHHPVNTLDKIYTLQSYMKEKTLMWQKEKSSTWFSFFGLGQKTASLESNEHLLVQSIINVR